MDQTRRWGEKRYHSLDLALRSRYGEKIYKITLNGGMTCPNRDGKAGTGGCIFCSAKGSGDFAGSAAMSVPCQLKSQVAALRQRHGPTVSRLQRVQQVSSHASGDTPCYEPFTIAIMAA